MGSGRKQYAVIICAASVMGKAYARELAKREINLVLISSPDEGLEATVRELMDYGIEVTLYETDFTSHQNLSDMTAWINSNFEVALLINISHRENHRSPKVQDAEPNFLSTSFQLNVMSVSLLTRELIPNLMRQRKAYILNVWDSNVFTSSQFRNGFQWISTFVDHFTLGLSKELKDTNVFVSHACVGGMQTNNKLSATLGRIFGTTYLSSPDHLAAVSIRRLFRKQSAATPGLGSFILRLVPIWTRLRSLNNVA